MLVVKATSYGFRTVIGVVLNPHEPHWIHEVGSPYLGDDGVPLLDSGGNPLLVTERVPPLTHSGDTCHNCRNNWQYAEAIFDGDDQYYLDSVRGKVLKSTGMLAEELTNKLTGSARRVSLVESVGKEI